MKPKLVNIYKFRLCPTLLRRRESNPRLSHSARRRYPLGYPTPPNVKMSNVKLWIFLHYTTNSQYTKIITFAMRDLGVGLKRLRLPVYCHGSIFQNSTHHVWTRVVQLAARGPHPAATPSNPARHYPSENIVHRPVFFSHFLSIVCSQQINNMLNWTSSLCISTLPQLSVNITEINHSFSKTRVLPIGRCL